MKIRVEFATCDKIAVSDFMIFLEPSFVPLSPNTDRIVLTVRKS